MSSDCEVCSRFLREDHPLRICDLNVSVVNLHPRQYNLGRTVVVYKHHATELWQLEEKERIKFFEDMVVTATALNKVLKPDKMNYALLGNYIPHLHWHLIPRYETESTWGQPICPHNQEEKTLSNSDYSRLIDRIRTAIMELRTASTK